MGTTIQEAIEQLLRIVFQLREIHPSKRFTLDGRLVGDLGEVICEAAYDVQLYEDIRKHYDAETTDGKRVQIKATMQKNLSFPCDHIPEYYLGIKIHSDGTFTEVFNGPGSIAWEAVKHREPTKNNIHMISINSLLDLNGAVDTKDRIPRRADK